MGGFTRLPRGLITVAIAIGTVAGCVAWFFAAYYIARISADAQLICRLDNYAGLAAFGLLFWKIGSVVAFLLAGAGLAALVAYCAGRGRRAGVSGLAVSVLLAALCTWGYVVATHAVMRDVVARGAPSTAPSAAGPGGVPRDFCSG